MQDPDVNSVLYTLLETNFLPAILYYWQIDFIKLMHVIFN